MATERTATQRRKKWIFQHTFKDRAKGARITNGRVGGKYIFGALYFYNGSVQETLHSPRASFGFHIFIQRAAAAALSRIGRIIRFVRGVDTLIYIFLAPFLI
jgi:hypothetical protein